MVAPGIYHVKARLVDLIGSSGIENATSAQPKNLASAPRLSPLWFFGGVAGDETREHYPFAVFSKRNSLLYPPTESSATTKTTLSVANLQISFYKNFAD